jgi:hypothetical protein
MAAPLRILVELYIEPKTNHEYDITRTEVLTDLNDVLTGATRNHDSIPWKITYARVKPRSLMEVAQLPTT